MTVQLSNNNAKCGGKLACYVFLISTSQRALSQVYHGHLLMFLILWQYIFFKALL